MIVQTTFFTEPMWFIEFDPDTVQFRIRFTAEGVWKEWHEWLGEPGDEEHFPADYIEWLPDL